MKNKKQKLVIFFLVSLFLLNVFSVSPVNAIIGFEYEIEGDKVYVDNDLFYMSASPHTISSDGWVEFEFKNKDYSGDLDFVWGFNRENTQPQKPIQIWKEYLHYNYTYENKECYGDRKVCDVTSYQNLGIENYNSYKVDWGTENNNYLFKIYVSDILGNRNYTMAFTEYETENNEYMLSGNYIKNYKKWNNESYKDWKTKNLNYEKKEYNYEGMTTWYILKNQATEINKDYKIRYWVNIPFSGLEKQTGKYWYGFKPSNMNFQTAISNNKFFYLDPWWDTNYRYSKAITIHEEFIDASLTNFPVLVNCTNASMLNQMDGGDSIVFTSLDNTTVFNHEIEEFTSKGFSIWVNISEEIIYNQDYKFMIYWNNSGASDSQNITGVWDSDYILVHHFAGDVYTDLDDSTAYDNDVIGEYGNGEYDYEVNDRIGQCIKFDDSDDSVSISDSAELDSCTLDIHTLEVRIRPNADFSGTQRAIAKWSSGSPYLMLLQWDTSKWYYYNSDNYCAYSSDIPVKADKWYYMTTSFEDADAGNSNIFENGTDVTAYHIGRTGYTNDEDLYIGADGSQGGESNCIFDELRISDIIRSDGWISATYHSLNRTTGFMTYGKLNETAGAVGGDEEIIFDNFNFYNNSNNVSICHNNFSAYMYNSNGTEMDYTIELYDNHGIRTETTSGTENNITVWLNFTDCLFIGWNYTIWFNATNEALRTFSYYLEFRTDNTTPTEGDGVGTGNVTVNINVDDIEMSFDFTQFGIILQILLFAIFMYISYKIPPIESNGSSGFHYTPFNGGLFLMFAGFVFISLSFTAEEYLQGFAGGLCLSIGILIIIMGTLKAFYYPSDDESE